MSPEFRRRSSVVIIVDHFPAGLDATFSFVEQLVFGLCALDHDITVISPQSRLSAHKNGRPWRKYRDARSTPSGDQFTVLSPTLNPIASAVRHPRLGAYLRYRSGVKAVIRALRTIQRSPDAMYAHFFATAGLVAADVAARTGVPCIIASGESNLEEVLAPFRTKWLQRKLASATEIIAVSPFLASHIQSKCIVPQARVSMIPNGVDTGRFFPAGSSRNHTRKTLGIADDEILLTFVGYLRHRKGPLRVMSAVNGLAGVKVAFVGTGSEVPRGNEVAFVGPLPNSELPKMLQASDAFILPTLAEGCCNAILEALACGLPVISSDRPFNDGILDATNSIRVDPLDIEALRRAVLALRDDRYLRRRLASGAARKARGISMEARAIRVSNVINNAITSERRPLG